MPETSPPPEPSTARRVLAYVGPWMRGVLEGSMLGRSCVSVSTASSADDLVAQAASRPDLIVLEWNAEGRDALQRLRAQEDTVRVAMAAPRIASLPAGVLLLPSHDPEEWDRRLGEWLDIPHRSEARTSVALPGSIRNVAGRNMQPAVILDLSRNGALIRTDTTIPLRTVIALRFSLPGAHDVDGLAVVRRHSEDDQGRCHGVRFVQVSGNDAHAIGEFLRSASSQPQPPAAEA